MGKFAGLLGLLGLWMLVAGRGEAISTGQIRSDSMYIVHMDNSYVGSNSVETPFSMYSSLLRSMKQETNSFSMDDTSTTQPVHIYRNVFSGFSARLTDEEVEVLKNMGGVLGVHPDRVRYVQTTHTPEFLGLSETKGLWSESDFGDDVIVGVLDTGIWPESASFSDKGLGPIPARWKGKCQIGQDFNITHCNKKLIGATYFSAGYEQARGKINETQESRSARDTEGHGTHTASTAAGAAVPGASLNGLAPGTARGMATKARIAMYKICWDGGCFDSDIAAAFDQAVADGVDVISLSVGGGVVNYYDDSIAIGAFGAMKKGIFVSCSAGNSGPIPQSVSNIAPWMITVAASTLDRKFPASVILGNNKTLDGVSLYRGEAEDEMIHDLVYGGDVASKNASDGALCSTDSLNPELVKGKIVVCMRGVNGRVAKGAVVQEAGGFGMVLSNTPTDGEGLLADSHVIPATLVGAKAGAVITDYIKSSDAPVAKFKFGGTQLGVKPAPVVASFSSRGPNLLTPQVLKPDITAPGVNILAAWTGSVGPTGLAFDNRKVPFNIISGTSMSCPHISGLGALLKAAHPEWSPSAIKSAMMTTASVMSNMDKVITDEATTAEADPFGFGSGHIRPEQALKPGLIYDMGVKDYVQFLCASGYTPDKIKIFTGETATCPLKTPRIEDMNYPSFSAIFTKSNALSPIKFKRTVTNVGHANSSYTATIYSPEKVSISVSPEKLTFSKVNEKLSYTLTVKSVDLPVSLVDGSLADSSTTVFGFIQWSDGTHVVQSPVAITVQK
jgi:subtilisin family serine protease